MREICFRGERKDNGKWIEGYYFKKLNPHTEDGFPLYHGITDLPPFGAEVFPETVGQFTGLQDENGKRIFEGDIVDGIILHNMPIRAVVAFQEGAFGLDWQRGEVRVFTAFTSYCNTVFTVIGNIHDNPDLLKGE